MPDNPAKPPRFPYVAALLCVGCVGMAGYLWMRYSYAWEYRLDELVKPVLDYPDRAQDIYVSVKGLRWVDRSLPNHPHLLTVDRRKAPPGWWVEFDDSLEIDEEAVVVGRLRLLGYGGAWSGSGHRVRIEHTASRFHGASIAGLVVGAMGVFVFTVALRHWLGERRSFRERDEGA